MKSVPLVPKTATKRTCRLHWHFIVFCFLTAMLAHFPAAEAQITSGTTTTIVSAFNGQCAAITNGATTATAGIIQWQCGGQSDQNWTFVSVGSSYYHIVDQKSGLCLNVNGNSNSQGTQLIQDHCQGTDQLNDQWQLVPVGNNYHIVSRSSGQCVNIYNNSQTQGTVIVQWNCQDASQLNDQFSFPGSTQTTTPPATPSQIISANSGLCVGVQSAQTTAYTPIIQWNCNQQPDQTWSLQAVGSNYHVVTQQSGLCLNVNGNSTNPGTQLIQYPCQDASLTNDQWKLVAAGSSYQLMSVNSELCVSIANNSTSPGAAVIQDTCQASSVSKDKFNFPGSAPPTTTTTTPTEIIAVSSGQCLGVQSAQTTDNALIVQWGCGGDPNQQWSFVAVGSYYHIVTQQSGKCLNVPANATTGTQLVQHTCQDEQATSDQWQLMAVGNNYHIVSRSNGQCVNISSDDVRWGAAVIQSNCQAANLLNDQFTLGPPKITAKTLPSTWSSVIPLPVDPVAVANLPNGKLLMWASSSPSVFEGDRGYDSTNTYTALFDPTANSASEANVTSPPVDMFCPGTAVLSDGRVLVNGGSSSPKTTIYDPIANNWVADRDMNIRRGYEGDTPLANGSVFTLGGSWAGDSAANKTAEVWTEGSGWTELGNVPETNIIGPDPVDVGLGYPYRGDNHLWLIAQSNGSVFHAGPSTKMNWITTSGAGSIQSAGNRGDDPFSINGNAALYDVGKILKVGGAPSYDQDDPNGVPTYATNSAYLIDISKGPGTTPSVTKLPGMNYRRSFANSVILPNGNVVIIGGQMIPQTFTDTAAVLAPEMWNPSSQTFSVLNPMQTPRTYHSTAILLPDGRVFSGGGGLCSSGGCNPGGANHLNAEILTPPYLLNADGSVATRPKIKNVPTSATRGKTITVTTDSPITSFVLMRLSAVTHSTNNDQRRIPLQATSVGSTTYSLSIPSDPGIVLPGYYMLFALNSQGVPSVSSTVNIP